MNILFIDLETTGLDKNRDSVLQIAAEYYEGRNLKKTFNEKFYSGHGNINLGALKVNKATMAHLKNAPEERQAVENFVDFLLSINSKEPIYVAGENVKFDLGFIEQLLQNHQISGLDSIISHRAIDTASLSVFLKDVGLLNVEKLGLERVAKHLNLVEKETDVLMPQFHDAGYDAHKTAQVYFALVDLVRSKL
jgi:DNA polymerase-3 subunit epsilon